MHTGLSLIFQNLDGHHTDAEVYREELALAARAKATALIRSGPRNTISATTS
ncbi:MAG: hypothetical protein ACKVT1_08385 [Dehalococcoidia bacterium]